MPPCTPFLGLTCRDTHEPNTTTNSPRRGDHACPPVRTHPANPRLAIVQQRGGDAEPRRQEPGDRAHVLEGRLGPESAAHARPRSSVRGGDGADGHDASAEGLGWPPRGVSHNRSARSRSPVQNSRTTEGGRPHHLGAADPLFQSTSRDVADVAHEADCRTSAGQPSKSRPLPRASAIRRLGKRRAEGVSFTDQYMPPIPPPGIGGVFCSSFFSTTTASVVRSSPAIEAAFCSAVRTTLVGSITPASTRSS